MKLDLDEIYKEIKSDMEYIVREAGSKAAYKIQKDIEEEAHKYIDEYYNEYNPKMYRRLFGKPLHDLVEKTYDIKVKGDKRTYSVGIVYNPFRIEGIHTSNSRLHQSGSKWISRSDESLNEKTGESRFKFYSGDNGIPEPEWITDNFYNGIHPRFVIKGNENIDNKKLKDPEKRKDEIKRISSVNKDKTRREVISKPMKTTSPDEKMKFFLKRDCKLNFQKYANDLILSEMEKYFK